MNEPRFFDGPEHRSFSWGDGKRGALLIHGFMGTPAEMRPIGTALHDAGWRVRGLALPGFGPEVPQLASKRRQHWQQAVRYEWELLSQACEGCIVVGHSMGGALAIILATDADLPRPPAQLILTAPFWRLPAPAWQANMIPVLKYVLPKLYPFKKADFNDPTVRRQFQRMLPDLDLDDLEVQNRLRQEAMIAMTTIDELRRVGLEALRKAEQINTHTLIVQGQQDTTVLPQDSRHLMSKITAPVAYHEIEGDHELIQDHSPSYLHVIQKVLDFIEER